MEMGGKISLIRARDSDFALNRVLKWMKRAKHSVFVPKITCFVKVCFAEHRLLEEIILNEVSLGGSPTISATMLIIINFIMCQGGKEKACFLCDSM